MNVKKSFIKGAAVLALAGVIAKVIGALYRIPLVNAIGAGGMAYYSAVYPIYGLLLVISSAGFPTAISKLIAERLARGDEAGARDVLKKSFQMLFTIGLASTLLLFLLSGVLANATGMPETKYAFMGIAPALLFVALLCALRGYFQGRMNMTHTAISQVIEQVVKLGLGLFIALSLLERGTEYAAMGIMIGVSASELIALLVIFIAYLRKRESVPKLRAPSSEGKSAASQLITIAIPVTIGAAIMPIAGVIDSFSIVNILSGLPGFTTDIARQAFGVLQSTVAPLVNVPAVITMALAASLVPAISADSARRNAKGVRQAATVGIKLALLIGLPCAVGLFVLARPILSMLFSGLTPSELTLAVQLLQTAAVGVVFLSLVQTLTGILQGMGFVMVPVINLAFGAVIKIIAMLVLVRMPNINIQGAAVSTVLCYAAAGIMDALHVVRRAKLRVQPLNMFVKPALAAVVMGVLIKLLHAPLQRMAGNALSVLVCVAVGVAAYFAMILLLRAVTPEDLELIPGGKKLARLTRQI